MRYGPNSRLYLSRKRVRHENSEYSGANVQHFPDFLLISSKIPLSGRGILTFFPIKHDIPGSITCNSNPECRILIKKLHF